MGLSLCWRSLVTSETQHVHRLIKVAILAPQSYMCIYIYRSLSRDSLRGGRTGNRIPVWAKFSAQFKIGPGAHPASYTMGFGSFLGVKRPGRGVDHSHPSSAEVKECIYIHIYIYIICSTAIYRFLNFGAGWGWMINDTPRPLYPQEGPKIHCIGGWVGPRADLEGCGKTRPHRDSIPGPSSP